jgi:adenine-specific DNA-methyltransferase
MIYPRLRVARDLLTDNGVIFISISEEEIHSIKTVCNEVFGQSNFRNTIFTRRYDKNLNRQFMEQGLFSMNTGLEYILMYSKSPETKFNPVFREVSGDRSTIGYWKGFWNDADRPTMRYNILGVIPESGQWKWNYEVAVEAVKNYAEYIDRFQKSMTLEEYWEQTGKQKKFIRRNPNGKGKNRGVEHWVAPTDGILRNTNWSDLLASKPIDVDVHFDSPKNIEVLNQLIKLSNVGDNGTILDFFSGSATTAHAVMQRNAEDGGKRKFIMVQLPEPCPEDSEAAKAGYANICEIGKERIRRAGQKIKESLLNSGYALRQLRGARTSTIALRNPDDKIDDPELMVNPKLTQVKDPVAYWEPGNVAELNKEMADSLDTGFRVLKLDSSNMKNVYYTPQQYVRRDLNGLADNIKVGRTAEDLLFQVMLDLGILLSSKIEQLEINSLTVFSVADNYLLACFERVDNEIVTQIAKLKPYYAVFRDSSFTSDSALANFEQIFNTYSPTTIRKVL